MKRWYSLLRRLRLGGDRRREEVVSFHKSSVYIFLSVFSVVVFFETTEFTEVELHQTRPTSIFLFVLRGYFFETTEYTKEELHQTRFTNIFLSVVTFF